MENETGTGELGGICGDSRFSTYGPFITGVHIRGVRGRIVGL